MKSVLREVADLLDKFPPTQLSIRNSNYMKELFYRFYATDKVLRELRIAVREANEELPENNAMIYTNRIILTHTRFLTWIENSLNLDYFPASVEEVSEIVNTLTSVRSALFDVESSISTIPMNIRSKSFKAAKVVEEVKKAERLLKFAHEILMDIHKDISSGGSGNDDHI